MLYTLLICLVNLFDAINYKIYKQQQTSGIQGKGQTGSFGDIKFMIQLNRFVIVPMMIGCVRQNFKIK